MFWSSFSSFCFCCLHLFFCCFVDCVVFLIYAVFAVVDLFCCWSFLLCLRRVCCLCVFFAPPSSSSSASLATTSTNDNNKTYTATTRITKPRYTYSINSIKTCHKNIWTYHHFTFELISMRCAAAPSPTQFELRTRPTPKKCRKTKQLKENQHLKQYPPGN